MIDLVMCFAVTVSGSIAAPDDPPAPPVNLVGSASSLCLLLDNPKVRDELALEKEQLRSCMLLTEKTRARVIASYREMRRPAPSPRSEARSKAGSEAKSKSSASARDARALEASLAKETVDAIETILDGPQLARFKQIALQAGTVATFLDPSVKAALKLDDRQVTALVEIQNEARRTIQSAMKAGKVDREEIARKALALRQEGRTRALNLLSADQKATWERLIGEPFFTGEESPQDVGPKKEIEG